MTNIVDKMPISVDEIKLKTENYENLKLENCKFFFQTNTKN